MDFDQHEIVANDQHLQENMNTNAQSITINGKKYGLDELSESAKSQIGSLRACDAEIARLEALLAIAKTARGAYARALGRELDKSPAA